jgi:hypothetical protein
MHVVYFKNSQSIFIFLSSTVEVQVDVVAQAVVVVAAEVLEEEEMADEEVSRAVAAADRRLGEAGGGIKK